MLLKNIIIQNVVSGKMFIQFSDVFPMFFFFYFLSEKVNLVHFLYFFFGLYP